MQIRTALVVDDSRVARMTLGKLLKARGFELTELDSGEEAITWLQVAADKPDIIFMDVMMEGMDGLTTTRQIKAIPELAAIPVVICTGNDSEADLSKARDTGAVAVLAKPPADGALSAVLDAISVEPETVQAAVAAPEPEPELEIAATPTPSPATFDTDAIIENVMQRLEQTTLPDLRQQMRNAAEDISRQVAGQVAEEASNNASQKLMPEWTRQVIASVEVGTETLKERIAEQAQDSLNRNAGQAVEQAIQNYGLTEKLMAMLRSEGSQWLQEQQDTLQRKLLQELQQSLPAMVNASLGTLLEQQVPPLVNKQLAEMESELETQHRVQVLHLQKQVSLQTKISIAAVAAAVIALVVAII